MMKLLPFPSNAQTSSLSTPLPMFSVITLPPGTPTPFLHGLILDGRRIRQRHVPDPKRLLPHHAPVLHLVDDPDMLRLLAHGDEEPARSPQLVHELFMRLFGRRADVDRVPVTLSFPPSASIIVIVIAFILNEPQPPVRLDEPQPATLQHRSAVLALGDVGVGHVDEGLDVLHADDFSAGADEVGEHGGQVARAGADVQDAGAATRASTGGRVLRVLRVQVQEGQEGLGGHGVHVRGGDCGAVADSLGGVGVGARGGEVGAVDLDKGKRAVRCQLSRSLLDFGVEV